MTRTSLLSLGALLSVSGCTCKPPVVTTNKPDLRALDQTSATLSALDFTALGSDDRTPGPGADDDDIYGGGGNDELHGQSGDDTIRGNDDDDNRCEHLGRYCYPGQRNVMNRANQHHELI